MVLFFLVFLAGAVLGSGATFLLLRRFQQDNKSSTAAQVTQAPTAIIEPPTAATEESKASELDAQRKAATAHIQAQREAARAQREATRLAAEAAAQREAERLAAEAAAQREAERLAAEAAAQREAERLAAEAAAQREAERLAAEAAAQREAERMAAEAAAQREAEEQAAAEQAQSLESSRPDKTPQETIVMIVDDSKVGRIKTNRFIQSQQFKSLMAEDGRDALQKIAAQIPDIVITDVEMPVMDGFELTQAIRSNPTTAHLPVIIISGNNDGYADRASAVGADLILGKPYSESDMVDHLHRFMRNGR